MRAKYRELYGNDPQLDAYFAYSIRLLRDAEAGTLPMPTAEALVAAREDEILAQRSAETQQRARFVNDFNPLEQ